jgi:RNA polymerase sigma factor (sigma-70 family)
MNTPHEGQVERANTLEQQAAANSGNHSPIGKRQTRNDHEAFESLLLIVFAALSHLSQDSSPKTQGAFLELTQILRRYVASVLAKWGIPSPRSTAEDVVQDLFVRLLDRKLARRYDQTRSLRGTFLFGVLRRVLSEFFRKMKPGRTVPLPADLLDPTPYPDEALSMCEIRDSVSAAIGRLRPAFADAIRAQFQFDNGVEAAEHLGLTLSAFYTCTSRARQALREDLKARLDS